LKKKIVIIKLKKYIENYEDSLHSKIEYYFDGMNIEIKKLLYIFIEMIELDIIILFENHEDENQFLFDI
jgi:hypothetical protein